MVVILVFCGEPIVWGHLLSRRRLYLSNPTKTWCRRPGNTHYTIFEYMDTIWIPWVGMGGHMPCYGWAWVNKIVTDGYGLGVDTNSKEMLGSSVHLSLYVGRISGRWSYDMSRYSMTSCPKPKPDNPINVNSAFLIVLEKELLSCKETLSPLVHTIPATKS